MKKLLFVVAALAILGCDGPSDEVHYTRSGNDVRLKIVHRNNGNSCSIELKTMQEAEQYKIRLQKLVKEIDDYEKELTNREKN